jgi:hypothetical protein
MSRVRDTSFVFPAGLGRLAPPTSPLPEAPSRGPPAVGPPAVEWRLLDGASGDVADYMRTLNTALRAGR